jgi:hypothetical protein
MNELEPVMTTRFVFQFVTTVGGFYAGGFSAMLLLAHIYEHIGKWVNDTLHN